MSKPTRSAASRLIVAFDSTDLQEALRLAKRLRDLICYAKIGSVLFTAAGPAAIQRMQAMGLKVFLDLKFHDIPSTVEKSCRAAVRHGVWMLTVHASGERKTLEAAVAGTRHEAERLGVPRPRVIGVTVLTSAPAPARATGGPGESKQSQALRHRVVELAARSKRAGLDGVVTSAREASAIRRRVGKPFLIICPGIRLPAPARFASSREMRSISGTEPRKSLCDFSGQSEAAGTQAGPDTKRHDDQVRVTSPREAVAQGADFLVVGRPITEAKDPRSVVQRLLDEIGGNR